MLPILPPAPSRTDPTNFSAKADAWVDALDDWTDAANALEQSLQLVATTGTSTSSLPIGTGSKGLTTQTGKAWAVGSWVYIASASAITNLMQGQVTAYNAGTGNLVVNVTQSTGSGTYTDWVIALASPTTTSAGLSGGVAGSIPWQSGVNTTSMLAPGTPGQILSSGGGGAPSWITDTTGVPLGVQIFNSAGSFTYTSTPGTKRRFIRLIGGGGGSASVVSTAAGQIAWGRGGGVGALAELDSTYDWNGATLQVGGGGSGGSVGFNGGSGGDTYIGKSGNIYTATGGGGGTSSSATSTFPLASAANAQGGTVTTSGSVPNTHLITNSTRTQEGGSLAATAVGFVYIPSAASHFSPAPGRWYTTVTTATTIQGAMHPLFNLGEGAPWLVSGPSQTASSGVDGFKGSVQIYEYA